MENNAFINLRLEDLLEVMDARATVNIFVGGADTQRSVKFVRVYAFITEPELMREYGDRKVIGLTRTLTSTNILIEEV